MTAIAQRTAYRIEHHNVDWIPLDRAREAGAFAKSAALAAIATYKESKA